MRNKFLISRLQLYTIALALIMMGAVLLGYILAESRAAGSALIGDINLDGVVNVFDLSLLLSHWGTNDAASDLNHDGAVNIFDLSILLSRWGDTGPTPTPTPSATPSPSPPPTQTPTPGGVTFNTCTNPTHTLPTNPSNPQDGITLNGYYLDTDTWNIAKYPNSQQTIYACDYNNWYAMVNATDTNGEVQTYPNVHKDFGDKAMSSFSGITSLFAHTAPSNGDWDYAYDIWLNNYGVELMIWTQSNGRQAHVPGIAQVGTVTLSGITYNIHKSGSYIAYDMPTTRTSGNLNILEIINDMKSRGYITSTATLTSVQYGVEVCNTNSINTKFELNNFSVVTQ